MIKNFLTELFYLIKNPKINQFGIYPHNGGFYEVRYSGDNKKIEQNYKFGVYNEGLWLITPLHPEIDAPNLNDSQIKDIRYFLQLNTSNKTARIYLPKDEIFTYSPGEPKSRFFTNDPFD